MVCHINHGIRENAIDDENYVKNYCELHNVPFFVKTLDLKDKTQLDGMSTEEAGRKARYEFFKEILARENATKIATAHNLNDNAETVLLNVCRGSGVSGLKGILPISGNIIRPLIECTRSEIEEYCKAKNINPRHDESNDETEYTRNKFRLEVIPYLEKNVNANVINNIARMASIVAEQEEYINGIVQEAYDDIIIDNNVNLISNKFNNLEVQFKDSDICNDVVFSLKKFNKLPIFIRKRLILKGIFNVLGNAKDIEKVHIDDIVKMCENNVGGKYLTPKKYLKVSISNHKIFIEKVTD